MKINAASMLSASFVRVVVAEDVTVALFRRRRQHRYCARTKEHTKYIMMMITVI